MSEAVVRTTMRAEARQQVARLEENNCREQGFPTRSLRSNSHPFLREMAPVDRNGREEQSIAA